MSLSEIVQSSGWKNFIAKLYGFGASVVIVGALFKIQHWHGANFMLTLGLLTEAVIFFFSAFEPLHEEVDWSLVYPELAGISYEDSPEQLASSGKRYSGIGGGYAGGGAGSAALAKFDEMLEKAEITPELFMKLGSGMQKLGDSAASMNAMGDVSAASSKFVTNVNTATDSLGKLNDSYQAATRAVNETGSVYKSMTDSLSLLDTGGKNYQQQLELLNKNLGALNAVYELQRKSADQQVKEADTLNKGIQNLLKDLSETAGDTKKYKEQIATLNQNLTALNNVYGNMLAAMNVK